MARGKRRAGAEDSVSVILDPYIIKTDTSNWSLFRMVPGTEKGEKVVREIELGHYPTLSSLMSGLLEQHLRTSDLRTLTEIRDEIRAFRQRMEEELGTKAVA
jgi:hypothetical protein